MNLLGNPDLREKRFIWDETNDCLHLLGAPKQENKHNDDGHQQRLQNSEKSQVYCPHAYLEITFVETLDPAKQLKFRKHYLRKVATDEANIIILQDIKDLVMFLVVDAISVEFIRFFHVPVVDRFLRTLIIYFQHYIEIWVNLHQKRSAVSKKVPNPHGFATQLKQKNEMDILRSMLAREYCDILIGAKDTFPYHHMNTHNKSSNKEPSSQSQGEKDLRIYETFLRISHRVVWIALKREHLGLIEVEMNRLFRTGSFNNVRKGGTNPITADMSDDEIHILHGEQMLTRKTFLRNSPLSYQITSTTCDYRVLSLGLTCFKSRDPRIQYLENVLLANEEELPKLGIKIGILGEPRSAYDVMLHPIEEGHPEKENNIDVDENWEKRHSSIATVQQQRQIQSFEDPEILKMPSFGDNPELFAEFPMETVDSKSGDNQKIREYARKKWIARAIQRSTNNFIDATSIVTNE